ncbi:uncharacterized protein LOC127287884 isoform X2 [Leptopilina boulardi]|uniref:uncharacterized protein LOC127287884 isoform X2 n=1 Tax=Leptopilina boulardi TaxID=63433 RepID=UPI0021F5A6AB|nr:uncharacterized protein LOC127287884 isoform X2 [Leptopilina boulardi]
MALYVSSTQNSSNVKNNGSLSTTICAKCICCPYGYHIDLDFVRYCEAVSAESNSSRSCSDKREKKEHRRKCQSMEFLLGLVSPGSSKTSGSSIKLSKLNHNAKKSSSPETNRSKGSSINYISELDLSDVVDDFEATLQYSSESNRNGKENKKTLLHNSKSQFVQPEITSIEQFDDFSISSVKSNLSTEKLQVQLFVLAEEKRKLLQELREYNGSMLNSDKSHRLRSHSFSENQSCRDKIETSVRLKRDIGISCTVMTRDIGVSHQQVQTRDAGILISLPSSSQRKLTNSKTQIEYIMPVTTTTNFKVSKSTQSDIPLKNDQSMLEKNCLNGKTTPFAHVNSFQDCGINTVVQKVVPTNIPSDFLVCSKEDKFEMNKKIIEVAHKQTMTLLTTNDIKMVDDITVSSKNHLNSQNVTRSIEKLRGKESMKDKQMQTSPINILRNNMSITAKPVTFDSGTDTINHNAPKSVAVGPDLTTSNSISLNSMNLHNTPFKYDDIQLKKVASKYVNVTSTDLIKSASKHTDTFDLRPRTRDFGTSPVRKKFIDMSVGESLKFNENVSCATNYCDNCKNISNQLKNQVKYNMHNISQETTTPTFHRAILEASENNSHLKKKDNKEQYENDGRLELNKFIDINDGNAFFEEETVLSDSTEYKEKNYSKYTDLQFQTIKPRKKLISTKEIVSAIKIINDNFEKSSNRNNSSQIKSAYNLIQQEWFKISSTENANPRDVADYLDFFQDYTISLLKYIVNVTDCSGNTAMHYAVSFGNFDIASTLLNSQVCDLNKPNTAGYTAVMLAALADVRNFMHMSIAKRIFENSNVNLQSKMDGQTALMLAVSHGRMDMIKLLIDAGAEINIQDDDGSTALMCAAEHGHIDIVRLLLNQPNCDSSILDTDGSSALKIALEAGHHNIGVLLYAHVHVNKGTNPYFSVKKSRKSSRSPADSCASASINLG